MIYLLVQVRPRILFNNKELLVECKIQVGRRHPPLVQLFYYLNLKPFIINSFEMWILQLDIKWELVVLV
jgi:hypothetical protein